MNTTLEQDKATLLTCWKLMGKSSDYGLRQGAWDDASKWRGVTIHKKRVTKLDWGGQGLFNHIPKQLGALRALTVLDLHRNRLDGYIPGELGNLDKLKVRLTYSARSRYPFPDPFSREVLVASEKPALPLYSARRILKSHVPQGPAPFFPVGGPQRL